MGSSPTEATKGIEAWCSGNTMDFGSVISGSNPDASTKQGNIQQILSYLSLILAGGTVRFLFILIFISYNHNIEF